jgi:antitoxin component YwqK of YwqJK toxin-antitoxin module
MHGKSINWYSNGGIAYIGNYQKGVPVGKQTYWHRNGRKQREFTKDEHGNVTGYCCEWYDNGLKLEEYIKSDHERYMWKRWNRDGVLLDQMI